jgi:maleate isomerase
MAFGAWRGSVGLIIPVRRPGILEQIQSVTPRGICFYPAYNSIRHGSREEFSKALDECERRVAECAEVGVDLINPMGAPPFMILGHKSEAELIRRWEKKYKTPIFTAGQNHITALKALKAKRIIGASYFPGDINKTFARYFEDAGFEVLCMDGIEVPFNKVQELSGEQVYAHIKKSYVRHLGGKPDAIYMLGSGWRTLHIVQMLEQDLGLPVVHPVPARVWEVMKRLHVNEPKAGFGTLMSSLPKLPG